MAPSSFVLLLLLPLTLASRLREEELHSLEGRLLAGRYQLLHRENSSWFFSGLWGRKDADEPKGRMLGKFPWGQGAKSPLNRERFLGEPELLGTGNHGEVWRAHDQQEGRDVAVKVMFVRSHRHGEGQYITQKVLNKGYVQGMWSDPMAEARGAHDECELVQRMVRQEGKYPEGRGNLCRCLASHALDFTRDDDVSFLVIELCGESLEDKLKKQMDGPRPDFLQDARRWVKGWLKGVAFMSSLEVPMMHMGLKPVNVVVTDNGEGKLIDFGRAVPWYSFFGAAADRAPPEHYVNGGNVKVYAADRAWAFDTFQVGTLYWDLLCRRTRFDRAFKTRPRRPYTGTSVCADGTRGLGKDLDWDVVEAALAPYQRRKPPQELIELLP